MTDRLCSASKCHASLAQLAVMKLVIESSAEVKSQMEAYLYSISDQMHVLICGVSAV